MAFLWLGGCALLSDRARGRFGRGRLRRGVRALAGGVLIGSRGRPGRRAEAVTEPGEVGEVGREDLGVPFL
jgi:hypothetical protein